MIGFCVSPIAIPERKTTVCSSLTQSGPLPKVHGRVQSPSLCYIPNAQWDMINFFRLQIADPGV